MSFMTFLQEPQFLLQIREILLTFVSDHFWTYSDLSLSIFSILAFVTNWTLTGFALKLLSLPLKLEKLFVFLAYGVLDDGLGSILFALRLLGLLNSYAECSL